MKTRGTYKSGPLKSRLRITRLGWAVIVITVCLIVAVIAAILIFNSPIDPTVG